MDERVAQYLCLYSCLFQTTVQRAPDSFAHIVGGGGQKGKKSQAPRGRDPARENVGAGGAAMADSDLPGAYPRNQPAVAKQSTPPKQPSVVSKNQQQQQQQRAQKQHPKAKVELDRPQPPSDQNLPKTVTDHCMSVAFFNLVKLSRVPFLQNTFLS